MNTQNTLYAIDRDLNALYHFGIKGQKKHQHDPNRRWQRQAVYANGQPDPNAKETRAEKNKSEKKHAAKSSSNDFHSETDRLRKTPLEKIEKDTRRLRIENDYLDQLARRSSMEVRYKEASRNSSNFNRDKILGAISKVSNSNAGVLLGNLAMMGGKQVLKNTVGKDFSEKLFKGTRIGGKK